MEPAAENGGRRIKPNHLQLQVVPLGISYGSLAVGQLWRRIHCTEGANSVLLQSYASDSDVM